MSGTLCSTYERTRDGRPVAERRFRIQRLLLRRSRTNRVTGIRFGRRLEVRRGRFTMTSRRKVSTVVCRSILRALLVLGSTNMLPGWACAAPASTCQVSLTVMLRLQHEDQLDRLDRAASRRPGRRCTIVSLRANSFDGTSSRRRRFNTLRRSPNCSGKASRSPASTQIVLRSALLPRPRPSNAPSRRDLLPVSKNGAVHYYAATPVKMPVLTRRFEPSSAWKKLMHFLRRRDCQGWILA